MQNNITEFDMAFKLYLDLIKKLSDDQNDADDKLLARAVPVQKHVFLSRLAASSSLFSCMTNTFKVTTLWWTRVQARFLGKLEKKKFFMVQFSI